MKLEKIDKQIMEKADDVNFQEHLGHYYEIIVEYWTGEMYGYSEYAGSRFELALLVNGHRVEHIRKEIERMKYVLEMVSQEAEYKDTPDHYKFFWEDEETDILALGKKRAIEETPMTNPTEALAEKLMDEYNNQVLDKNGEIRKLSPKQIWRNFAQAISSGKIDPELNGVGLVRKQITDDVYRMGTQRAFRKGYESALLIARQAFNRIKEAPGEPTRVSD